MTERDTLWLHWKWGQMSRGEETSGHKCQLQNRKQIWSPYQPTILAQITFNLTLFIIRHPQNLFYLSYPGIDVKTLIPVKRETVTQTSVGIMLKVDARSPASLARCFSTLSWPSVTRTTLLLLAVDSQVWNMKGSLWWWREAVVLTVNRIWFPLFWYVVWFINPSK